MKSLFATWNQAHFFWASDICFPLSSPNHNMFIWSVWIHLHPVFGSAAWKHSVIPSNMNRLLGRPCFFFTNSFQQASIGCAGFFFLTNFAYWSNSCFLAAKKNVPNCKDFIFFKRPLIREERHEQDLISRTLSHCRSSEILLCFCQGVLRHPGTKSSTLITRLWKEERRSGENSYFWHNTATEKRPHARASSQNWARVFPVCKRLCVGGMFYVSVYERGEIGRKRKRGRERKEVLK